MPSSCAVTLKTHKDHGLPFRLYSSLLTPLASQLLLAQGVEQRTRTATLCFGSKPVPSKIARQRQAVGEPLKSFE